jgi:hypothetical protein
MVRPATLAVDDPGGLRALARGISGANPEPETIRRISVTRAGRSRPTPSQAGSASRFPAWIKAPDLEKG